MQLLSTLVLSLIAVLLIGVLARWVRLLLRSRQRPWTASQHEQPRRHLEVLALLCLATLALGLRSQQPELSQTIEWFPSEVTGASASPSYRTVQVEIDGFASGEACRQIRTSEAAANAVGSTRRTEKGLTAQEAYSQLTSKLGEKVLGPESVSWAMVIGGHDRQPYRGSKYESNSDLAFARARCVKDALMAWLKPKERPEPIHVFLTPGSARSDPTSERDVDSDRVVDIVLYVKQEQEAS